VIAADLRASDPKSAQKGAAMTVAKPHRLAAQKPVHQRPAPGPMQHRQQPQVPKVVREATDRFIKKYERTLRDLEKY
jgi:hypothetical protein